MNKYVYDTWYPLAWSRDVGRSLTTRRVVEVDLVVYRTAAGTVTALDDACPHKLAPLSIGTLKDDQIECGYHGLTFDCAGRCVRVPGQANVPPSIKVRAYPTVESMGLVWVWMGRPERADPAKVFRLPQYDDPAFSLVEG
jgi:vanillate O-demethylase monooxygenase subunit